MVPSGGLPSGPAQTQLPPPGAKPPEKKEEPPQAEPPKEEEAGPKYIRIKCPACTKVFKAVDTGDRPLHINCKHCGAKGTIDLVPGTEETPGEGEEEEPKEEEPAPEPIPIVCPSCDNLFELDEVTDTAKCPICGAEGDLDEDTIHQLEERFGKEDEEITLKCPTCAGTFKVKGSDSSIICPFCGATGKPSS
jgi:DNA-directed RNA polymerase subunit RPC12/RpoP